MLPILLELGPLTLRAYGVLIAVAFLAGLGLVRAGARLRQIPEQPLLDLAAILIVSGLVGARLFYVLLSLPHYLQRPLDIFKVWEGGLVFYGGFLTAAVAGVYFIRRKKLPLAATADVLAPALALGQAVGRWGCFLAGCCYGQPAALPWAVRFENAASLAPLGVDLHPVQLYESFGSLVIALVLWQALIRRRDSQGDVFWFYVLLYGILRFGTELFRGDDRGPAIGGLFPSQGIALLAIVIAASVLLARRAARERSCPCSK